MPVGISYGKAAAWGLVAGIVMALVTMMVTALMGMGLWAMPSMIAALVLGPSVMMGATAGAIMIGLAIHMLLSMLFGVVYAAIVNFLSHEFVVTAMAFGLLLWIVNFYAAGLFLPGAQTMAQHEPVWLAITSHLVFGMTLGLLSRRSVFTVSALRA
ncbi:MAG: hypothetical protein ABR584_01145 [Candidatus Baltobacteraceae bacterium]